MVVDDTKLDRFISSNVRKRDRFAEEISDFNSAASALDHLSSVANSPDAIPDIIFLDINMSVMDGFDFLDNYMKLPEAIQKRCSIIMISSTNSQDDFDRINSYPAVRLFLKSLCLNERFLISEII